MNLIQLTDCWRADDDFFYFFFYFCKRILICQKILEVFWRPFLNIFVNVNFFSDLRFKYYCEHSLTEDIEILADLNGYYVHLIFLWHIYQFFRHSLYHIQDIFLEITLDFWKVGILSLAEQNIAHFLVSYKVTTLTLVLKQRFSLRMHAFTSSSPHLYCLNTVNESRFL